MEISMNEDGDKADAGKEKPINELISSEPMRVTIFSPKVNPDEIFLDMEDLGNEESQLNSQSNIHSKELSGKKGVQEVNILSPAITLQESEAFEMQRHIDALLERIGSTPLPDNSNNIINESNTKLLSENQHDDILQSKKKSWPSFRSRESGESNRFNELWYLDYFDPSFNENPWENLENKKKNSHPYT